MFDVIAPAQSFARLGFLLIATTISVQAQSRQTGPFENEAEYMLERSRSTVQLTPDEAVGLIQSVHLNVSDQVEDGCWTNVSAIYAKIRAELERSAIAVYDEQFAVSMPFAPLMSITVVGYRAQGDGCVASAVAEVAFYTHTDLGSLGAIGQVFVVPSTAYVWRESFVLNSPNSLNAQLLELAGEWSDRFTGDVLKARRSETVKAFLSVWPDLSPVLASDLTPTFASDAARKTEIGEEIKKAFTCKFPFSPQAILLKAQSEEAISLVPFQTVDGIPSFEPAEGLTFFGLPVASMSGWDSDGSLFSRGPGTAPPVHIALTVAATQASVLAAINGGAALPSWNGIGPYLYINQGEFYDETMQKRFEGVPLTKIVCSIG